MDFVNAWTKTENGANALQSTNNSLVDLFGVIGSLRTRSNDEIERLFINAFAEDPLLATKMGFYARDIRQGGLGERHTVRVIWKYLANNHPEIMKKNLHLVPVFGRFDDWYEFVGTPVEDDMWEEMNIQLAKDIANWVAGRPISLLAKWMKSINTSSKESVRLGKLTAKKMGFPEPKYRKFLSMLRQHINVTETKMSSGEWDKIDYESVPSKAMANYRKAFQRHDEEGFSQYIKSVTKGEKKINSGTLFPYEIFEKMGFEGGTWEHFHFENWDQVLEEQWKALPNYVEGEHNVLIMGDTSSSMTGRPMCTSVGLAIYFAERNKGPFKDVFMTFSRVPSLVVLAGDNLKEKIRNVPSIVENTNLEAAFNLVLDVAVKNQIVAEQMPKAIVVISDMEIDRCTDVQRWTFYESMRNRYKQNGYEIPNIVFWNVESRHDVFHAQSDFKGVQLASGQSPSVFKAILQNIGLTPYEAMLKVLNSGVYDCVSV